MRKFTFINAVFMLIFSAGNYCLAQRGKDGAKTISSSVMVNEYTPLQSNVSAGVTSISVVNSSLNSNGYFSGPLAPGDLIFIIQIQGASFNTPNDSTYGT